MKGDITLFILKFIQGGVATGQEILDTISYYGYHESYRRARGLPSRIPALRRPILEKAIANLEERKRISKLIFKLKSEDLISKDKRGILKITDKGEARLQKLKKKTQFLEIYQPKESREWTLIAFDIPEKLRGHRDWLRTILGVLGFKKLQKSLFMGKVSIPEELFKELNRRGIGNFVEIFAITRSGTLRQIQ